MKNFSVFTEKGIEIKLNDSNYVSEGGEGKIFVKNNIVYKIYHDKKNVISPKKFKELSVLQNKNIINPKELLYDNSHVLIGYTMDFISDTVPLARLFTTSFRNRNLVTPDMSIKLVEKMMETIQYIHEQEIIMVDGNEFNYLIDGSSFIDPYFIDVDSYMTKNFPAKVIMPSIRDYSSANFNELTDWYSFAIIATQIFIGIHPFKGNHPKYTMGSMVERMKDGVSIFNSKTTVPASTRPFTLIPNEYLTWFTELFENGKRVPPPQLITKNIIKPQITIKQGNGKFIINKMFSTDSDILGIDFADGHRIIYTQDKIYLDNYDYPNLSKSVGIIYFENTPYEIDILNGNLSIKNFMNKQDVNGIPIPISGKMIFDNRIYILQNGKISEITLTKFGDKVNLTIGNSWNILPNASKAFRGLVYSNILGKAYLYIPIKKNAYQIIAIPELDGCKIIDAKYENNFAAFLVFENAVYTRKVFIFNSDHTAYNTYEEKDIGTYGINFIGLPNNMFVYLHENADLEVGNNKGQRNLLSNTNLDADIQLVHNGTDVYYFIENEIYSFKMK